MYTNKFLNIVCSCLMRKAGAAFIMLFVFNVLISTANSARNQYITYPDLERKITQLIDETRYATADRLILEFMAQTELGAGKSSASYANAISLRAYVLLILSQRKEAERLFQQAIEIYNKIGSSAKDIAIATNNIGYIRQIDGKKDEAEKLYLQALELQEKTLPANHEDIATSLANLANLHQSREKYKRAEGILRRALAIRTSRYPPNHPILAATLQNLATAVESQRRLKEAETLIRRALKIRRNSQPEFHPERAGAMHRLGVNLYRQRRHKEAVKILKKAIWIRRKSAAFFPELGRNLTDLAQIYILYRKYSKAMKYLLEARDVFTRSLPDGHLYFAELHRDFAYVYEGRKRIKTALKHSRTATRIYAERNARDISAIIQYQNHLQLAWKARRFASRKQRTSLAKEAFKVAQQASVTATATSIAQMAARLAANNPDLEIVARNRQDLDARRTNLVQQLTGLLAAASPRTAKQAVRTEINTISREIEIIDKNLLKNFPEYQRLVRPLPTSIAEIRGSLLPSEALIFFSTTYDAAFVWAVSKKSMQWQKLSSGTEQINKAIKAIRAQLDTSSVEKAARNDKLFRLDMAHDLFKTLFGPVKRLINSKRELIIVSSGALTALPFQVLITAPPAIKRPRVADVRAYIGADWFVRKWAFSILPAVSNIPALRKSAGDASGLKSLIGFGDPSFSGDKEQKIARSDRSLLKSRSRRVRLCSQQSVHALLAQRPTRP